jgi:hypothetical protein
MFFESGMAGSCTSALVEAPIDHHSAAAAGEGAGVVLCCCCNFFATRISQSGGALGSAPETRPTQVDSIFSLLHHHFLSCTLGGRSPSFRLAATSFPHRGPSTSDGSSDQGEKRITTTVSHHTLNLFARDLVTFINRRV